MLLFSSNLKYLRKKKDITQLQLGQAVGVSDNALSNYEKGKFYPTADVLMNICEYFNVSADDLLLKDLSLIGEEARSFDLPPKVENTSNIWVVAEDQAEYAGKWSKKFARTLTHVSIPGIEGESRIFEVYGNSMTPLLIDGDYVVCTPCSLAEVQSGKIYAIVRGDSLTDAHPVKITYAQKERGRVLCIPANSKEFTSYHLDEQEVKEVWEVEMRITRNVVDPWKSWNLEQRLSILEDLILDKFPVEKLR